MTKPETAPELHEAGRRAATLAQNPVARSLLAAGLVTAAAALAANKNMRDSAKKTARQAQDAAEAAADAAADSANKIGAAMINAATEAVRRMLGDAGQGTESAGAIEVSKGSGLGEPLRSDEGMERLASYAGHRSIESWAGKVAGAGMLHTTLGIPRSTLNDWRRRGAIIGLLRGQRKHVYPLEQFVDARPLPGIHAVSETVGDVREAWLWLRQPHGRFDMKTPLRALGEGKVDQVVEAANRDFR